MGVKAGCRSGNRAARLCLPNVFGGWRCLIVGYYQGVLHEQAKRGYESWL